jgi:uncharacterized protein (DUF2384 family)
VWSKLAKPRGYTFYSRKHKMASNTLLLQLLTLTEADVASRPWSAVVAAGVPRTAFSALVAAFKTTDKALASALNLDVPYKKEPVLDRDASDAVYRVANTLSTLNSVKGWELSECVAWLRAPCVQLKNRVPLELLSSSIGCDYTATAITRL